MSFFLWAGLFCLSFTWLFTLNLYTVERDSWWIILLVLGVLFNSIALRGKTTFYSIDRKYYLLPIPLIVSLLILPFPYHLGVILVLAGLLVLYTCCLAPFLSTLSAGLIFSGAVLIIQSPLGFLYTTFTSFSHSFYWLDAILAKVFAFLNLSVSYSQHEFYIQTIKDLYAFPTTWEKLAFFPLLNIWAGSIPLFYLFYDCKARGRGFIKLFLSGTTYLIIRYAFMIAFFLYLMTFVKYREDVCWINIFWDARITLLFYLPLVYFLCRIIPLKIRDGEKAFVFEKSPFSPVKHKAVIYFFLSVFFLGLMYGFQDPGKEKQGRVLLDEKHSGWEKSTRKMDTEWYGNESGYNFYWMAEFINHYFPLTRNFEVITPELLSNYDILLLKNATSPYSKAEMDAIKDFVRNGGGLYLMSEHTNIFGNSTYLNPIAEDFGFSFRYDVLFDIERKFEQLYNTPKLLPHPVIQNMPYFCFKVSCSIQPLSSKCESIILSRGIKAQSIYYPSGNFYPPVKDHTYMPFGAFLQMVGVKAGRGRVLGFTDSTTYSNFEAFFPGKPEALLGALNWLNRKNSLNWLRFLFITLAAVCFLLLLRILKEEKETRVLYLSLIIVGVFSMSGALGICQELSQISYPVPRPRTPFTKVVFEQEHGDYELPLKGFTKDRNKSYEVFYQWVLRVGYYPFTGKTLEDDIKDAGVLIIINPNKRFSPEDISRVKKYLEKGGKVLLMDGVSNISSTSNELLSSFGMEIKRSRSVALPPAYSISWMNRFSQNRAFAVGGGDAVIKSPEGVPVFSAARVGKGMIGVMGFSGLFLNPAMGGSYRVKPNQQQKRIYDLEFNILKGLYQDDLETYFKK